MRDAQENTEWPEAFIGSRNRLVGLDEGRSPRRWWASDRECAEGGPVRIGRCVSAYCSGD